MQQKWYKNGHDAVQSSFTIETIELWLPVRRYQYDMKEKKWDSVRTQQCMVLYTLLTYEELTSCN